MKIEPTFDKTALIETVNRNYPVNVARLEYVPVGEVSYSYLVESISGEHFFMKLLSDTRQGRMSAARLDFYLPLCSYLYTSGLFRNLAPPIRTRLGDFRTAFAGLPLIMYPYIEGAILPDTWPYPSGITARLAQLVARLHKISPEIRLEIPYVEKYTIPFKETLLHGLNALQKGPPRNGRGKQALHDLLLPYQFTILDNLDRLQRLAEVARTAQPAMVLCHTDLTHANLILSIQGELIILDWEGAMLAPAEHDLFLFTGEAFPDFLEVYEREYGPAQLHGDVFGFYFYRRNLEDLTDWIIRILYENEDEAQDEHDLEGIVEDCISQWPYLEARIRQVKKQLGDV